MKKSPILAVVIPLLLMVYSLLIPVAAGYAPRQGDSFSYNEVIDIGSGTGSYDGYSEHTVVTGMEQVNEVSGNGIVSAYYSNSWVWNDNAGSRDTGGKSGNFTFSSTTFLYLNGTDDQIGYVNPTVWFVMNSAVSEGDTFNLLNTEMTVTSIDYRYFLPSLNKNVETISAQGASSYPRNDQYGSFAAKYVWKAYFDPSSGYVIGYDYAETDTDSSGNGFTYTENLYVTSTSYPLVEGAAISTTQSTSAESSASASGIPAQYADYIPEAALIVLLGAILSYFALRRGRGRTALPQHPAQVPPSAPLIRQAPSAPQIRLTPSNQPPVQQIVIREIVKVKCRYCGALYDGTLERCTNCGAPRS